MPERRHELAGASTPPSLPPMRLRDLGFFARLGLSLLVLTLAGGYLWAGALQIVEHHQNRDGEPGLSYLDVKGAYHGAEIEAPLMKSMNRNHPPELPEEDRAILVRWLEGDAQSVRVNYDNPDFDAFTPREVIELNCLNCHAGRAEAGAGIALSYWDDVQKVAFPRIINPVDPKILLVSTHAHVPVMAAIALVMSLLLVMTRLYRPIAGILILTVGVALMLDAASWWLARGDERFVWGIILGGGAHMGAIGLMILCIIADLWLPKRRG